MVFAADFYRIRVRGHLDQRWADWFDGFDLEHVGGDTVLRGRVPDQAALHGALAKLRDLGLLILLVENYEHEVDDEEI